MSRIMRVRLLTPVGTDEFTLAGRSYTVRLHTDGRYIVAGQLVQAENVLANGTVALHIAAGQFIISVRDYKRIRRLKPMLREVAGE